jgi:hypothetical protein
VTIAPSDNATASSATSSSGLRSAKVGFAVGVVLGFAGFSALRSHYVGEFGKLDSPRFYPIDSPAYRSAPPTYSARLKDKVERLRGAGRPQNEDTAAGIDTDWFSARLPHHLNHVEDSPFLREFLKTPHQDPLSDFAARFGSPQELVARLFQKVTGQPLPSSIHLVVVDKASWPSARFSGSNHLGFLGVSLACDQDYLDTVLTLLHEVGHQICPVGEALPFESIKPELVFAREEAAAYTFEFAAIMQFEDPFLRDVLIDWFTAERDRHIERFLAGDTGPHAHGMMLADAALTVFRPDVAWREVGTGEELSPAILKTVGEVLQLRHELSLAGERRNSERSRLLAQPANQGVP